MVSLKRNNERCRLRWNGSRGAVAAPAVAVFKCADPSLLKECGKRILVIQKKR